MTNVPEIVYRRVLTYPTSTKMFYYLGVIGGIGFSIAGAYIFLFDKTESLFTSVGVFIFGGVLFFWSLLELMFNVQMIMIDERGIHTKGPNRRVSILWGNVDAVLCTTQGYTGSEFLSYYIVSKRDREIIKFTKEIDQFHDLCSIVSTRIPNLTVTDTHIPDLLKLYRQIYWAKSRE